LGTGDGLALATIDLPASGEKRLEIPADDFVPGRIDLNLIVDGKPEAGLLVCAVRKPGRQIDFARFDKSDANGRVRMAPLLPGEVTITIASETSGWTLSDIAKVNLPPAGAVDQTITVDTFEGTIAVLDGAGEPLHDRELFIGTPLTDRFNDVEAWARVRTDSEGKLSLRWPVDAVILSTTKDLVPSDEGVAIFKWTPAGPKPAKVRVH
jgi:hypothetical protein